MLRSRDRHLEEVALQRRHRRQRLLQLRPPRLLRLLLRRLFQLQRRGLPQHQELLHRRDLVRRRRHDRKRRLVNSDQWLVCLAVACEGERVGNSLTTHQFPLLIA